MTEAELDALALPLMSRMAEMGVPRCEATEEVVARVISKPHGRIFVRKDEDTMVVLVHTWDN